MRKIKKEELKLLLADRAKSKNQMLDLRQSQLENMDLSSVDLSFIDFSLSSFCNVNLSLADFTNSNLSNSLFLNTKLFKTIFKNATLIGTVLRNNNLENVDLRGANLYSASLEGTGACKAYVNKDTKWFDLYCPPKGAFVAYKKCVFDRILMLLVPKDAKRSSATLPTCRCDKAKVLKISSIDEQESYQEAWSLVDEDFVYRVGEWVYASGFNDDRFMDSTYGIHFWMTREEAIKY